MQTLKNEAQWASTNSEVVEVRQVGISNGEEPRPEDYARLDPKMADKIRAFYPKTNYTAVLFRTLRGERIVIMEFLPSQDRRDRPGWWWSRVYDRKKF